MLLLQNKINIKYVYFLFHFQTERFMRIFNRHCTELKPD